MADLTGIGSVFDFASKIIDKVFPDKEKADAAKLALFEAQQKGELQIIAQDFQLAQGQIEVNKVEAASGSLFVSGARPFILWGCGSAFLYAALVEPLMRFVATVAYHYAGPFPTIDTALTMQVLLGLLGLGGMRSWEKGKGVASK